MVRAETSQRVPRELALSTALMSGGLNLAKLSSTSLQKDSNLSKK